MELLKVLATINHQELRTGYMTQGSWMFAAYNKQRWASSSYREKCQRIHVAKTFDVPDSIWTAIV